MLKQEWICQDVLKEYRNSGRDPKEVPKSQFGVGLLACGEDCKKKVKVPDPELHLRKSQETKVLNFTPLNTKPCVLILQSFKSPAIAVAIAGDSCWVARTLGYSDFAAMDS